MKGLLLKDFCLLKKQMKLMVVFVIFYAIWAVAAKIPSMNKCHIVGDFFQVAGNMGRKQHAAGIVLDKVQQNVQYLVPDDGV